MLSAPCVVELEPPSIERPPVLRAAPRLARAPRTQDWGRRGTADKIPDSVAQAISVVMKLARNNLGSHSAKFASTITIFGLKLPADPFEDLHNYQVRDSYLSSAQYPCRAAPVLP